MAQASSSSTTNTVLTQNANTTPISSSGYYTRSTDHKLFNNKNQKGNNYFFSY